MVQSNSLQNCKAVGSNPTLTSTECTVSLYAVAGRPLDTSYEASQTATRVLAKEHSTNFGLKVFMDAHQPVTLKEGDRYPLGPPNWRVGRVVKAAVC